VTLGTMAVLEALSASRKSLRTPHSSRRIPCAHTRLIYRGAPLVMGILNVTPDSFSDGQCCADPDAAIVRGMHMAEEGADLIDVGGESTRPGALPVALEEELRRVIPVIARLAKVVQIPISVDTLKAEVARQAMDVGASIINDVSALRADPAMALIAAQSKAAVILMHMRGTPVTMQRAPRYGDVTEEVYAFLVNAAQRAEASGIDRRRLLIDPGLGFGKTTAHNLTLMHRLDQFVASGYLVVIGPSRKRFIGEVLDADIDERLAGTLACIAQAQRAGVQVVRVHDVRPAVQLIRMVTAMEQGR